MELQRLSHEVSVPGSHETLVVNFRCREDSVFLSGRRMKVYAADSVAGVASRHDDAQWRHMVNEVVPSRRKLFEQHCDEDDAPSAPVASSRLEVAREGRVARGSFQVEVGVSRPWWVRIKVVKCLGATRGWKEEKVCECLVPVPYDEQVEFFPKEAGLIGYLKVSRVVRIVKGCSIFDMFNTNITNALQVRMHKGADVVQIERFLNDVTQDLGLFASQVVTKDVVKSAQSKDVAERLTELVLETDDAAKTGEVARWPAWKQELALGLPVVSRHVFEDMPGVLELRRPTEALGGRAPIELAIERHEWALVRAYLNRGARLPDADRLLGNLLVDCGDHGVQCSDEEVRLVGQLMKSLAQDHHLARRGSLLQKCLQADEASVPVCGGPPKGFVHRWAEAYWRDLGSQWDNGAEPPVLRGPEDAAECGICFAPLHTSSPTIFMDASDRRVCGHYLCHSCAVSQKSAQDYTLRGEVRCPTCPFCRANFAYAKRVPDPVADPRGFFCSVQLHAGSQSLTQRDVVEALRCFLPLSESWLADLVNKLWHQWDKSLSGHISETDFFSEDGLWQWLVQHFVEYRVRQQKGPPPSVIEDAKAWFRYFDYDNDGRLSKPEILRALVYAMGRSSREAVDWAWDAAGFPEQGITFSELERLWFFLQMKGITLERTAVLESSSRTRKTSSTHGTVSTTATRPSLRSLCTNSSAKTSQWSMDNNSDGNGRWMLPVSSHTNPSLCDSEPSNSSDKTYNDNDEEDEGPEEFSPTNGSPMSKTLSKARRNLLEPEPLQPWQRYYQLPSNARPGQPLEIQTPYGCATIKVPAQARPGQYIVMDSCDMVKEWRQSGGTLFSRRA